jgi:hypothetical protein
MNPSGDSIRVVHPLFREEGGGSIPTSPLQLRMGWIDMDKAVPLNELWHSRLPAFTSPHGKCKAIGAEYEGIYYASAIWSHPVARKLNWTGRYELRRFAIAHDAPEHTASRMLRIMRLLIAKKMQGVKILMSYQDKDSHMGTIYRAAGWLSVEPSAEEWRCRWGTRPGRAKPQSSAVKVRWEYAL